MWPTDLPCSLEYSCRHTKTEPNVACQMSSIRYSLYSSLLWSPTCLFLLQQNRFKIGHISRYSKEFNFLSQIFMKSPYNYPGSHYGLLKIVLSKFSAIKCVYIRLERALLFSLQTEGGHQRDKYIVHFSEETKSSSCKNISWSGRGSIWRLFSRTVIHSLFVYIGGQCAAR